MTQKVKEVTDRYEKLFTKFAACHNIYNSAAQMTDANINELGLLIVISIILILRKLHVYHYI